VEIGRPGAPVVVFLNALARRISAQSSDSQSAVDTKRVVVHLLFVTTRCKLKGASLTELSGRISNAPQPFPSGSKNWTKKLGAE
jgi:hypothetical protein